MKLYEFATTRSVRCHWALRELGLSYETVSVDLSRGEARLPQFLKKNPFGRVPVLEDEGFILFESSAICIYLADLNPESKLMPPPGSRERALCHQWISLATTELEGPLWFQAKNRFLYPEELRADGIGRATRFDFERVMGAFTPILEKAPFLVGDHFTVADLMVTHILYWADFSGWLQHHDGARAYMLNQLSRESFPHYLYSES